MSVLLALHAGCSNQKKSEPPVKTKDASKVESEDGPLAPPITDQQLHELFVDARYCARPCAAPAKLRALIKSSPARVAAVALEIMADPESKTDQGIGLDAMFLVEDWLRTGPDEAARQGTSRALERVAATGSTFMRIKAYEYLARFHLPDAQRILIAEVENPARDELERDAAGKSLGIALDDFSLIRTWLRDDQPYHWQAALAMMKTFEAFEPGAAERRWDERRALIIALAKRAELPGVVVYDLAFWFDIYLDDNRNDAEILALTRRWTQHPDDLAAGQMSKVLLLYSR